VKYRPVGGNTLQTRRGVAAGEIDADPGKTREVDAAVVCDEDAAISAQRRAVGTTVDIGELRHGRSLHIDPIEQTQRHRRDDQMVVAPHRAFAERDARGNDLASHRGLLHSRLHRYRCQHGTNHDSRSGLGAS
jgi:hypothetical protein